jgi:hypothetical protein
MKRKGSAMFSFDRIKTFTFRVPKFQSKLYNGSDSSLFNFEPKYVIQNCILGIFPTGYDIFSPISITVNHLKPIPKGN